MSLSQINFEGKNRVEVAIMRLQEFEPADGYYFADSYGKDSSVVRDLLQRSGVKYDTHYSQGGLDAPELVFFGREYHPEAIIDRPGISVFKAIQTKGLPRRMSRWCCELIKEKSGAGRTVVTGIRWQESARRRGRRMYEVCHGDKTKMFLHPIIDWTAYMKQTTSGKWVKSGDVWEYIKQNNVPYCSLYDEGFKRLGCVLCPMTRDTARQIARWPKLTDAWKRAAYRYFEAGSEGTKRWPTAEAFWQWWLERGDEPKASEAQCFMLDN